MDALHWLAAVAAYVLLGALSGLLLYNPEDKPIKLGGLAFWSAVWFPVCFVIVLVTIRDTAKKALKR